MCNCSLIFQVFTAPNRQSQIVLMYIVFNRLKILRCFLVFLSNVCYQTFLDQGDTNCHY